ncbi:MAG: polysaccharide deacetylase family protein [Lachnospiraceae bacterium]|nr:polysaccharide deacetylase family protein [Lachnospiraceae bacterium]
MTKNPDKKDEATAAPVKDTIPGSETGDKPGTTSGTIGERNPETMQNPELTMTPGESSEENSDKLIEENQSATQTSSETATPVIEPSDHPNSMPGAIKIVNANYEEYSNDKKAWWFRRNKDHKPSGSGEEFPINEYSAYYLDKNVQDEDKVIYLTFDCGYENGFTPSILDTLAEKDVKVMFFVTKDFIVKNPAYVKRMKDEGHLVGNHTVRHLSSPDLTPEELEAELHEVARVMEEQTGYPIDPFFRPPMGEYSERTLKVTQDMGYASIFWSIAYYDYDVNDQPGKAYVVDHFNTYHHNGTIVLMHNVSESNTQALGDVIDNLKAEGYRFAELTELSK